MAYQPKSYRKLFATTATAAMVATAIAPAANAAELKFTDVEGQYIEPVQYLVDNNITAGVTDTKFGTHQEITRSAAAILLAKALNLDTENAPDAGFEDVNDRTRGAINAIKEAGILQGLNETEFGSDLPMNRQAMAVAIANAYDLTAGEDVELPFTDVYEDSPYEASIKALYDNNITQGVSDTLFGSNVAVTRGQFAVFLYKAELATEAPEVVEVSSVSAINASEVVVEFSTEVDATTAKDATNYEIKVNNVPVAIDTNAGKPAITVATDGKSAIIRLASDFQAGDKYVIQTNDGIKSSKGETLNKFVSVEKTFAESAAPKLLTVTPNKGANTLTVEFDRPVVGSTPLVKVDGYDVDGTGTTTTPLTATSNAAGNYKYTVSVTDATVQNTIFEKGTHEVIAYDVTDTAAAYAAKASVLNGSYTVTDEVTVPVVEEVISVNANRFFLQTNVAVDLSAAKLKVEKGNHEFTLNGGSSAEFITDTVSGTETIVDARVGNHNSKPGVWVVVSDDVNGDDENPLYKGTETSASLTVTLENYKDSATNSLLGQKAVKTVTLNKNNSKPVVESTQVSGTNLQVAFTNELVPANTTFDKNDVVVRNKDGVIISTVASAGIVADANGLNKVVEIALGAAYKQADEPYSVEFKAGELKYEEVNNSITNYLVNTVKNDKITTTVKSTSTNFLYTELPLTVAPIPSSPTSTDAGKVEVKTGVNGKDTVEIYYGREMTDSARTLSNYTLDGKALPAGTTVDFVDGKDKVRIVLPEGSLKASTSYKLAISTNVKTAENSTIVGSLQTKAATEVVISLDDNIAPELTSATYLRADEVVKTNTSTTQIELTFSEVVDLAADGSNNAINDLLDDLKVVVSGSTLDVVNVFENVDATGNPVADNKLVIEVATPVNVAQAATISVVAEADQKGDKTTYIVDTAGNEAKAGSNTQASTSKYSSSYAAAVAATAAAQQAVTNAQAAVAQAAADLTAAQATATQAAADLTAAQATATQAAADLTAAQAAVSDPANPTQAETDAINAAQTAKTNADAAETAAQTAKTNADAAETAAQTVKTNADAALATAQANLAAL